MQQKFYEALGNLFYSVAACDENIASSEIKAMLESVDQTWMKLDHTTDEFGTDAAHFILIAFDYLQGEMVSSKEAWENFEDFYLANKQIFSPKIKKGIKQTVLHISGAFAGINKAEAAHIKNIETLLKK